LQIVINFLSRGSEKDLKRVEARGLKAWPPEFKKTAEPEKRLIFNDDEYY
jgi:hypothetical protein